MNEALGQLTLAKIHTDEAHKLRLYLMAMQSLLSNEPTLPTVAHQLYLTVDATNPFNHPNILAELKKARAVIDRGLERLGELYEAGYQTEAQLDGNDG